MLECNRQITCHPAGCLSLISRALAISQAHPLHDRTGIGAFLVEGIMIVPAGSNVGILVCSSVSLPVGSLQPSLNHGHNDRRFDPMTYARANLSTMAHSIPLNVAHRLLTIELSFYVWRCGLSLRLLLLLPLCHWRNSHCNDEISISVDGIVVLLLLLSTDFPDW
jgi:hypothetical protein